VDSLESAPQADSNGKGKVGGPKLLFSTNHKPPFQGSQGHSEIHDFLWRGQAFFGPGETKIN
jgi:hypothetical protein